MTVGRYSGGGLVEPHVMGEHDGVRDDRDLTGIELK
jgi:hypothetical protein